MLTIPTAYAQMGLVSAILWQVFVAVSGSWTSFLLNSIYLDYRKRMNEAGYKRSNHVLQYHELMSVYLGKWGGYLTLAINILALGSLGVVQIIACASDIHILAPGLNKRDWALIFGGASCLTILIPTLHNYRVWSFLGLVATTYTSWFLVGAAVNHGVVHDVQRPSHTSLQNWFLGSSNLLFAYGGHSLSIEVMEGMWRPSTFSWIYPLAVTYTQTLTMPNAITLHQIYGSQLLKNSNSLAVVPASAARDVSIILMIMHQAVAYGLFVTPLYFMWEKAIGTHRKSLWIRLPSRIPVCLFIWFIALLVPFFGPINSVMGAFFTTWASYIIPGIAYIWAFRKKEARDNAPKPPPSFLARSWKLAFAISLFIGSILFVFGFGFGAWASILSLKQNGDTFGAFAACYQCTTPKAAPAPHAG
ncbi:hypothetical protein WJX73_003504 [Symbiochloris irregularis]|uniref:Amino acid transporter transmembrane domain-containing protein n=1 Tax=Symbiochloris irregularis TaxID=706552 RepID=A0AAW1PBW1_9CHLO